MHKIPLFTMIALLALASALAPVRGQPRTDSAPQRAQALLLQGRQALQAGDRFTALRLFAQARALLPEDRDVRQAVADVLVELGGNEGAALALGFPGDGGLRSRRAAERLRWAEAIPAPDPVHRFDATDAVIVQLEGLLAEAQQASPPDPGLQLRVRRDLVVALRQRERWADALAQAEALRRLGEPLPYWVRRAEADALLALRRPGEARLAYQDVLREKPEDRDARVGRFWSELEEEDFAAAFATADALAAQGAPTKRVGRNPVSQPDDDWLDAQVLAAQVRRFADMPADAWRRIEPLAREAPASANLREELGETAAARGWPRRAHEELQIARGLVIDDPGLEMALAESELRRREWLAAEERLQRLAPGYAGNSRFQRLQRELENWRKAELQLSIAPRKENGEALLAPGDGLSARARLYTPPLAQRWRVLAEAGHESSQPREDKLVRNRYGAGIEGRWPDLTLELIGWSNTGLLHRPGATVGVNWQPDDHWGLSTQLEAFTQETPLLALQAGIHADRLAVSAVHAWNESRVASAGLQALDFSDGNRRLAANLDYSALVYEKPGTDVLLRPSLYASRNTRTDAPYFNPRRDAALTLALDVQDRIWRRYERSRLQRVVLSVGPYWQDGFGTHAIASLSYEHAWITDPQSDWRLGISLSRRYYDGVAEDALMLYLRLNQRF